MRMDIEVKGAKRRILEAGQSEDLRAALRAVAELTLPGGALKYSPRVARELQRVVLCRCYAKPVYQLCHLIVAAWRVAPGENHYEALFFGGEPATPQRFRGSFQWAPSDARDALAEIVADREGIKLRYESTDFTLSYARMPLLSALLELLIDLHGYLVVDEIFENLFAHATFGAVREAASKLSKLTYQHLSSRLPTAENAVKFRAIVSYLEGRSDSELVEVDDEVILDFWCEHSTGADRQAGDFRSYRTVLKAFAATLRALELAERYNFLAQATPLGGDFSVGEVDPDASAAVLEISEEWESPLMLLEEEPISQFKLLSSREKASLKILMDLGPLASDLPLSLLRAEVFGKQQARITESHRRKQDLSALVALVNCVDVKSYQAQMGVFAKLQKGLERLVKGILFALLSGKRQAVAEKQEDEFLGGAMLREAEEAFQEMVRKGFPIGQLDERNSGDDFLRAGEVLQKILVQLQDFTKAIGRFSKKATNLDTQFLHDLKVFQHQFERRYGGTP